MRRMSNWKLGVAALVLATAGVASAQTREERRAELMKQADTNGNGVLEPAERQAMREQMKARWEQEHQELVQKYDANHDGKLDETERQTMRKERSAEAFKRLDTNGDGSLSLEEFQAGMPMRPGGRHGRR